jgi:hypothetical protein
MSKKLKITVHIIFVLGVVITITGWFFDRAKSFNWLVSFIAPDYVSAKQALNDLKQNEKIGLTPYHEGFQFLLDKWPNLSNKDSVCFIGRSVAFISFKPEISNDIELIAYDKDKNEVKERWIISEASVAIEGLIERKLFSIGCVLFWFGIAVSIVSYLVSSRANS